MILTDELTILIKGCADNNRSAQEGLYKMFYSKMMGVVRRYFDQPMLAEEVVNNAFLKAFKSIHQFEFKGSFEGWLRRITYTSISDYVRAHVKPNQQTIDLEYTEVVDLSISDQLTYKQLLELIYELPLMHRTVFNLYVIDGKSHKEIADLLRCSVGNSKWHLNKARTLLKERILKLENYSNY